MSVLLVLSLAACQAFQASPATQKHAMRRPDTAPLLSQHEDDTIMTMTKKLDVVPTTICAIHHRVGQACASIAAAACIALSTVGTPLPAMAVSGGGLDFAGLDISNQDFSKTNYKGKDFTQGTTVAHDRPNTVEEYLGPFHSMTTCDASASLK